MLTVRVFFFSWAKASRLFFFVVFLFLTSPKSPFSTFDDHFWFVVNVFFCFFFYFTFSNAFSFSFFFVFMRVSCFSIDALLFFF